MSEVAEILGRFEFPEKLDRFARRFGTLEEVWDECPRADWMLWMLETLEAESPRGLRLFICECARRWWAFMPDVRSQRAINAAERYSRGEVTLGAIEFLREGAIFAAQEAAEQSKPIMARAARLAVLALESDLLTAAREASELAAETSHAINETNSDEKQLMLLQQQANTLREVMANPFAPRPVSASQTSQQKAPAAPQVRG